MQTLSEELKTNLVAQQKLFAKWLKRMGQLELTPMERAFTADVAACAAVIAVYIEYGAYSSRLLSHVCLDAGFSVEVINHDTQFYDNYFDVNDDLIVDKDKLTLRERGDIIAVNYLKQIH